MFPYRQLRALLPCFCLATAACATGEPASELRAGAAPEAVQCVDAIAKDEAVRLAKDYAEAQGRDYQREGIRAGWINAHWRIFLTVTPAGEERLASVFVDPNGQVIECGNDSFCEKAWNGDMPSCVIPEEKIVREQEAIEIAIRHVARQGRPHDNDYVSASWLAAHWWVHFWPIPAYIDDDFTVHVSPDGKEFDLSGMGGPSSHGFVERKPGDETRPISEKEAIRIAEAYLDEFKISHTDSTVVTSWGTDHWLVRFKNDPPGIAGDYGVVLRWNGDVTDLIEYKAPEPQSCPGGLSGK